MTNSVCGAKKRDGSGDNCTLPAGWGTDHVGEGRCKLHGGNAGAPRNNQNAMKHGLHSAPTQYYKGLPSEQKEWIDAISSIIQDRIETDSGELDKVDRELAHRVAIELHISSRATKYIAENGLLQDDGKRERAAAMLDEVRQYSNSIFRNLKNLGALDGQREDRWRHFLESQADSSEPP